MPNLSLDRKTHLRGSRFATVSRDAAARPLRLPDGGMRRLLLGWMTPTMLEPYLQTAFATTAERDAFSRVAKESAARVAGLPPIGNRPVTVGLPVHAEVFAVIEQFREMPKFQENAQRFNVGLVPVADLLTFQSFLEGGRLKPAPTTPRKRAEMCLPHGTDPVLVRRVRQRRAVVLNGYHRVVQLASGGATEVLAVVDDVQAMAQAVHAGRGFFPAAVMERARPPRVLDFLDPNLAHDIEYTV